MHRVFLLIWSLLSFYYCETHAANAQKWRSRSIYQIVTDRFALSGARYNTSCDPSALRYCGGTWQGIIEHLDYIQGMGFDAIWISPPFTNVEGFTPFGEAYHGYWPQNLTSYNTHFGTVDDLKNLSASLHSRGMYLMLDVVVNHMVPPTPINTTAFSAEQASANAKNFTTGVAPFTDVSYFHEPCWIGNYSNRTEVEQCWLGNETMPWADVNTEDAGVAGMLSQWISEVISDIGVDGLRLSTVKYVSKDFWRTFVDRAGVFTMGEVLSNSTNHTSPYTEVMDAVLDYPTWFKLVSAFASPQGNLSSVVDIAIDSQKSYESGAFMTGAFLENHDQPRFGAITNDSALRANAMLWPFIYDGIPVLYYGQEQGFSGGEVPNNHEPLWRTGYNTSHPYYKMITSLNLARKAATSSGDYFLTTPTKFFRGADGHTLAVSKPPMLSLLTNTGQNFSSFVHWNVTQSVFRGREQLVDVLTCRVHLSAENGGADIVSIDGMPKVLMPVSVVKGTPELCPEVRSNHVIRNVDHSISWALIVVFLSLGLTASFP
ncbi:glycoside hydrolase family 13 protein [Pisolithus marmoratus]|nr:glycoside hydrolase family 13 protein [Pisolithus marmoratus]